MALQTQQILLDSIQKLLRRKADRNLANILARTHVADVAGLFRGLSDRDRAHTFHLIPGVERKAEVLSFADPEIQQNLLESISDGELIELLRNMSGDDAADVIELLDDERGARILNAWKGEEAASVDSLLEYEPDTAGGIMSPHVFALNEELTARQAIAELQENHDELETAFYLYVVNDHGHLVGVCSLRELVISDPNAKLAQIMTTDVISVPASTDQEDVARIVHRYSFLAVPVVDTNNRLVGVVTVDDVIDVIREEATEDMMLLAGAGPIDFAEQTSAARAARQRMPYLLASALGGLGAMFVIDSFSDELQKVAALAAFIPVTLGMGGNVGTQASTLMTRGLALGRVSPGRFAAPVLREIGTGVILGVIYGLLLGFVTVFLFESAAYAPWRLALTVGTSIAACMTVAATLGGAVPLLFHRIGVDPALATGPVVTTSVDVLGTLIYFTIGSMLLHL